MNISKIKEIINEIFSKDGFNFLNFSIVCPSNIHIVLKKDSKSINIDFTQEMPYIKVKKMLIPMTIYVEGLILNENNGSIKLKYFPDIYFEYEDLKEKEERFGSQIPINNDAELKEYDSEIIKQYPDEERRQVARLALQYTKQWADILKQTRSNLEQNIIIEKTKLKQDCENFVVDNLRNSNKIKARSPILSFILLYIIIPSVVNWIVKKFLERFL